jgi:ATP-dependent DNA ligase
MLPRALRAAIAEQRVNCPAAQVSTSKASALFSASTPTVLPWSGTPARWALEGIVSKRITASYRSGRSLDRIRVKNPDIPAMQQAREAEW